MKYIKYFESENYFWINDNEFDTFYYDNVNDHKDKFEFESKYFLQIKDKLKKGYKIEYLISSGLKYAVCIKGESYYDQWYIYQSSDEWFYVKKKVEDIMSGPYNDYYTHHKCDQFDGLLNYLKYILK